MTKVSTTTAQSALESRLIRAGYSKRDSQVIARHLLDAEINQVRSHGVRRLPGIVSDAAAAAEASPTITSSRSGVEYNAGGQQGIAAMQAACEAAISRVKSDGVVVVAVKGYTGTTGELGSYSRWLSRHGAVAIIVCNSEFAVAPHGSSRAILGTNPIAIGFPNLDLPFSADVATAAWSYGRIKELQRSGGVLPPGVVIDANGIDSTDPKDADEGSQLPMAGHKGYALGLAIELLAGPLIGAKAGRNAVPGGDGALMILVDVGLFRPASDVAADTTSLLTEVRNAPRRPGVQSIRIPGDSRLEDWPDVVDIPTEWLHELGID